MTDRIHGVELPRARFPQPVLVGGLLAAAAITAMAVALDGSWLLGGFALAVSAAFALVRKVPDSNELALPLPGDHSFR